MLNLSKKWHSKTAKDAVICGECSALHVQSMRLVYVYGLSVTTTSSSGRAGRNSEGK